MNKKTVMTIYKELKLGYYGSQKNIFDKEHYFFRWYRPLSFFPSAILIKYGISANTVTFFGSICLFAAFACFTLGYFILGAFLYLLAYIVDFMDGNIARYLGQTTLFGNMIDGLVDSLTFLLFVVLGFGNTLSNHSMINPVVDIFLGVSTGFIFLLRIYFYLRLYHILSPIKNQNNSTKNTLNSVFPKYSNVLRLGKKIYFGIISGMPVLLLPAVILNVVTLYLAIYFLIFTLVTLFEVIYGLRRVWLADNLPSCLTT